MSPGPLAVASLVLIVAASRLRERELPAEPRALALRGLAKALDETLHERRRWESIIEHGGLQWSVR